MKKIIAITMALFLNSTIALADTITLSNGRTVECVSIEIKDGRARIDHGGGIIITVPADMIASVKPSDPVVQED